MNKLMIKLLICTYLFISLSCSHEMIYTEDQIVRTDTLYIMRHDTLKITHKMPKYIKSRYWQESEIPSLNVLERFGRPSGTIYFVDAKNGNDLNDGKSELNAWKTISHAILRYKN